MSSTRIKYAPCRERAHIQESNAVRVFPRCSSPVGLGANRPRSRCISTLKSLMTTDVLSTRQVATLLGVGEATVKRWADAGEIECFRTPGGHRKFRLRDVTGFVQKRQFEVAGTIPSELPSDAEEGPAAAASFEKAALAGDASA